MTAYGIQSAVVVEPVSTSTVQVVDRATGRELVEVHESRSTTVVERELIKEVIEVIEPGPAGPPGPSSPGVPGPPGPQGPAGDAIDDLPDMTTIFENGLI